jgi:hypothetical protein
MTYGQLSARESAFQIVLAVYVQKVTFLLPLTLADAIFALGLV